MIKKSLYIAILLILIVVNSTSAQKFFSENGDILLSGEMSFAIVGEDHTNFSNGNDKTRYAFNPLVSFFLTSNLAVGGNFSHSQIGRNTSMWSIGPRLTYFIRNDRTKNSVKGSIYPYLKVGFQYVSGTTGTSYGERSRTGNLVEFGGGILYMQSESIGFLGSFSYELNNIRNGEGYYESGYWMNLGLGVAFFIL